MSGKRAPCRYLTRHLSHQSRSQHVRSLIIVLSPADLSLNLMPLIKIADADGKLQPTEWLAKMPDGRKCRNNFLANGLSLSLVGRNNPFLPTVLIGSAIRFIDHI